jgi:hypothetical protein
MRTLAAIRAEIDAANPITNRHDNGVDVALTKAERDTWLDAAAKEVYEGVTDWRDLRAERDALLSASDWTQAADANVDKKAWAAYRQALRDLPAKTEDPRAPVWPTKP